MGSPKIAAGNKEFSYGCIWYQGDKGGCKNGTCPLGQGFRAYFTFRTKEVPGSTTLADGFTFAVISAANNNSNSCGGLGSTIGYSSTHGFGTADQGELPFVDPPKIAAEFDFFKSGNFADPDKDHVGILYWGDHNPSKTPSGKDISTYWGGDDNHHNPSVSLGNPKPPAYQTLGTKNNWFDENGTIVYPVRFEIFRDNFGDTGNYTTRLWFNCKNCDDVSKDGQTLGITADAVIENTITLNATWHNQMDKVMFGWTQGTGSFTQNVTLSNAEFYFIK